MFLRKLRYWLNKTRRQDDLRQEMQLHVEEKTAELIERGLSASAARTEARRRFGNLGLKQEESREIWIARGWSDLGQDLRYGIRGIRLNPGFAAVAILSAALGIAACSTIFSIVNAAVLRPLPVLDAERLQSITPFNPVNLSAGDTLSFAEIRDIREQAPSWQGVAAFAPLLPGAIQPAGKEARLHYGFLVTGNYFDVVQPSFIAGGGFLPAQDDVPGAPAKIVLTHRLWVNDFSADSAIVGQQIQVNKRPMTVVGVTGPGFLGTEVGIVADFFLPLSQISEMQRLGDNPERMSSYGSHWLSSLGRLRPGADVRQAQAELELVAAGIRQRNPQAAQNRSYRMERAGQLMPGLRSLAMPAFLLLLAVSLLVLLTACANIANLMLARASARRKEIATRLAIGSGRGRMIRQLITESILLASAGGLLGIALTVAASRYIASLRLPLPLPVDLALPMDFRVILFSTALSGAAALAFGLLPALRATRLNLTGALRSDAVNIAQLRRFGLRHILVVAQIAISAVVVICSGLFIRSLNVLQDVDPGMDTQNVQLVRFDPTLNHYDATQLQRLLIDVLREVETLPGVQAASIVDRLPLSFGGNNSSVSIRPDAALEQSTPTAVMTVGPRYFEALGIPLPLGKDFPSEPSSENLVILNQKLAEGLFPNQNPLGRYLFHNGREVRVIAVAANTKLLTMQESNSQPILYRPLLDSAADTPGFGGFMLLVKTAPHSALGGNIIVQRLRSVDPELVIAAAGSLESHVQDSLFFPRLSSMLFGASGVMGLLIASIGIYGVISFAVARRTREIGIRMALGARASQVTAMVLRHGAVLALIGISIGLAGGFAVSHAAGSLIYGISTSDPLTFAAVPLLLFAVAFLATVVPARRAARVDPNRTFRME